MSELKEFTIKGRRVLKKRGMLFTEWCKLNGFEYMIQEVDTEWLEDNYGLNLNTLKQGFDKKIRWICHNNSNHIMWFKPVHRTNGHWECSYCKGSRMHLSEHSVWHDLRELVGTEWDYEGNDVSPKDLSSSYTGKVSWRCSKCGNVYMSSPYHRKEGRGCPYCCNLKIIRGFNDLFTERPDLEAEWDFDKNDVSPYEISAGSNVKVWWKCSKSHSSQSRVCWRAKQFHSCPLCVSNSTSFPELTLRYYLSMCFTDLLWRDTSFGVEYDFILPDEKVAIELNGYHWHENKENMDEYKRRLIISKGYKFIRVMSRRDSTYFSDYNYGSWYEITCYCEKSNLYTVDRMVKAVLSYIFKLFNIDLGHLDIVDTRRDYNSIIDV